MPDVIDPEKVVMETLPQTCPTCGAAVTSRPSPEPAVRETPRTDTLDAQVQGWGVKAGDAYYLMRDHARQLERELEAERRSRDADAIVYESAHDAIERLTAELAEAHRLLTTASACELGGRNSNLLDYMKHWEGRALAAESQASELRKALEELVRLRDAEAENAYAYLSANRPDEEIQTLDIAIAAGWALAWDAARRALSSEEKPK